MNLVKVTLFIIINLSIGQLGLVEQSQSADLGLLVKNSASLDTEEQAAFNFASSHGFTVTKIDPAAILADLNILNTVDGFWAANNSAPSGFDNPTISAALKSQLEGGKGLLITWYGNYMAQYLGLGTASLGSSWNPVVSDHEYWVDEIDDHPVFESLSPWIPPDGPPDDDSKLLYYVTSGYIPIGNIRVNWSVLYTEHKFAQLWTSYGWCGQSFDPALQAQFGITGTCERSIQRARIREAEVGSGSVIMSPCSMAGGDHWHWGEMGFQMIENMLTYVCSGGQPSQGTDILLYTTRDYGTGLGVRRWDYDEDLPAILAPDGFTVTAQDRETLPELTSTILTDYDQLWFVSTESGHILNSTEVAAINEFHNAGKGLMIIGDSYTYDGPANQISEAWGVQFSGQIDHCGGPVGCPLSTSGFEPHEIWNGVSQIQANLNEGNLTASSPAQIIASHNTIGMVAIRDADGGRVAWDATVYRFTDASCHPDVSILHYDNAQYVRNLVNWLAGSSQPPPAIETQLVMTPVNPTVRTGEAQNFQITLTDNEGNPVPWKTINFTWEYSGLEPVENFNGSGTRQTDLLGQCNLNWFSKWAAFDGNVTVTMTASFAGDGQHMPNSFSTSIMVDPTPAQIFARVFKDIDGNGSYAAGFDPLIPNVDLTISSAYNDYNITTTSTTGEYVIFVPKCAYDLTATVSGQTLTGFLNTSDFIEPGNVATIQLAYVPPRHTTINGTVIRNGNIQDRVTGADVQLYYDAGGGLVEQTTTDDDGTFSFSNLYSEQDYVVFITAYQGDYPIPYAQLVDVCNAVEVSIVADIAIDEWLTQFIQADHCLSAFPEDLLDISDCFLSALKQLFANSPWLCIGPVADQLCEFVEDYFQALANPSQKTRAAANHSGFLFLTAYVSCDFKTRLGVFGPQWKLISYGIGLPNVVDRLLICLNELLSNIGTSLASHPGELANALQSQRADSDLAGYAVITKSPVWICVTDELGRRLTVTEESNSLNEIGYGAGIVRDSANHELAVIISPTGSYYVEFNCFSYVASDTTFGLYVLLPSSEDEYRIFDFKDIPISVSGKAWLTIPTATDSLVLHVDFDSDGLTDLTVTPSSVIIVSDEVVGFSSLDGAISDGSSKGLSGITVDIYLEDGNLWGTTTTDDSGYYHVDSIPNGTYSATVVTPLGYQVEQETKQFTICHIPVTVDFSLTKLDITPSTRSRAYWAHQLCRAFMSWPNDYTLEEFSQFTGLINVHFNQNQVNPVDFYSVPQPADQADSLRVLKKLLHMCNTGDWEPFTKRLAKAQLISLMLNVVSGRVSQTHEISVDGRTVSQAITYCDMLVNDEIDPPNGGCRYLRAGFILGLVNWGLTVPSGMIPEDVIEIAYRIHNQDNTPTGFSLSQNYPNPFNPECEIRYDLPCDVNVNLTVYNVLGQKVRTLIDEYQTIGQKSVHWNGKDDNGCDVASGIYFYRLDATGYTEAKKMALMR